MAVPKETLWNIDPHTLAKHEILKRYLNAWFPILNRWNKRIIYIDGFSGPGKYKGGEKGSPLIALDVVQNHRRTMTGEVLFWFIDERLDRIKHLKRELSSISMPAHFKIRSESGFFHEKLREVLDQLAEDANSIAPTFAFVDPFGFSGIPFDLIERLLGHGKTEVFITFMVDPINRFLEHPSQKVVDHIVKAFGTEKALEIANGSGVRITQLRKLYQSQLKRCASFVRFFEMRQLQDRTLYYLFFAGNNRVGHLKMKEAMWGVDPDGEFKFSDATDDNQIALFESDHAQAVAHILGEQFTGAGELRMKTVREFVEDKTGYLKKHMTAALRLADKTNAVKLNPIKAGGSKRISGTFPDDALIQFKAVNTDGD